MGNTSAYWELPDHSLRRLVPEDSRLMRVLEAIAEGVAVAEQRGLSYSDAFLAFDPARRGYVTRDLAVEALVNSLYVGYLSAKAARLV